VRGVRKRVLVAGLGDAGLLVAIELSRDFDVVGVSPKPALVSGQELGVRLARPDEWKRDFLIEFERYQGLDGVRIVRGRVVSVDPALGSLRIEHADGHASEESWDALVLSPGVTNGFWRNAEFEDFASIERGIRDASGAVAGVRTLAVVGGGASGVSAALNLAAGHPERSVHLFFGQDRPLPAYHPRIRAQIERSLRDAGVSLHPGHRARVPEGFALDGFTRDPLCFSTGQAPFSADLTLWTIGRMRPNTGFVPPEMLDAHGFIRTDRNLRVPGHPNVFAVGDAAATDPNRSSARNRGYGVVAHNVRVLLGGRESSLRTFEAPAHRWGSILGVQPDGLRVFDSRGRSFRMPRWFVDRVLFPIVVRKAIYRGIRPPRSERRRGA
jgi:NADH dehydrogenase FAD-containing subunit